MNKKELEQSIDNLKSHERAANERVKSSKQNYCLAKQHLAEIQNQLKGIEKELEALPWKPEEGEAYYVPTSSGFGFSGERCIWRGTEFDRTLLKAGYVCQTEEEATGKSKQIYFKMWFENLGNVTEEMWEDKYVDKYSVWIHCETKRYFIELSRDEKREGTTYFTSEDKINEAIETIGKDNFDKYVLGIKR